MGIRSAAATFAEFRAELAALGRDVDRVRQDAGFQEALDTAARFWRYSPCNQWLIQRARPSATRVAARLVWTRLGRTVATDAEAIRVVAPTGPRGFPFISVDVFDIAQTSGRELASLDLELKGRTRKVAMLEQAASGLGIRVTPLVGYDSIVGRSLGGEIQIRDGLAQRERTAVLSHELAHELLHQQDADARRSHAEVETEAEATSYIVMRALGLPSKAPTYIAWRGGSGALIARSLRRIQRASRQILDASRNVKRARIAPSLARAA